ncbi:MAG: RNA pseudouridine synthase, partial [Prevotella sp.]|nr:RNA pseudouridine synthase [Prevotella sp.]
MRYNNHRGEYDYYEVHENAPLLEWLLANVKGSKNKIKDTLQGRGVKVNGKVVTQFDTPLTPGMKVSISKT